jgi:CheY-like chemotaxis protein
MSITRSNSKLADQSILPFSPFSPSVLQPPILVFEDHDDTRDMLCMLLEGWGFRVLEATNGLEAVEVALRERPQLILMDSRLPFIDGLEAARRIRENGLLKHVKILALNGAASPEYHEAALASGCDDSIAKPFDLDRLREYVVQSCSKAKLRSRAVTV